MVSDRPDPRDRRLPHSPGAERIARLLDGAALRHPSGGRPRPDATGGPDPSEPDPAGADGSDRRVHRARRAPRPGHRESFVIRPASAGGFRVVEAALARKLWAMGGSPDRLAVIVALDAGPEANLFTQTLVDREGGAWVEAVGNECILPEDRRLGDDQHLLLEAFGFAPPAEPNPNHHVVVAPPVDWDHVASLLMKPLEAVYGLDVEAPLEVRIFPVGPAEGYDSPCGDDGPHPDADHG